MTPGKLPHAQRLNVQKDESQGEGRERERGKERESKRKEANKGGNYEEWEIKRKGEKKEVKENGRGQEREGDIARTERKESCSCLMTTLYIRISLG